MKSLLHRAWWARKQFASTARTEESKQTSWNGIVFNNNYFKFIMILINFVNGFCLQTCPSQRYSIICSSSVSTLWGDVDFIYWFWLKLIQHRCAGSDDLVLTQPNEWLNDQCIEFWWDHVVQFFPQLKEGEDGIIFVCPSVMHMLNFLEPGEAESVLNDLKLDKKDLVIMPINNNQQNSVGGSHWALLCF